MRAHVKQAAMEGARSGGRAGKCPYPYPYPSAPPNLPPSKCKATAKAAAAACHCVGQMMCQTDTCRYTRYEILYGRSARGVPQHQTPNTIKAPDEACLGRACPVLSNYSLHCLSFRLSVCLCVLLAAFGIVLLLLLFLLLPDCCYFYFVTISAAGNNKNANKSLDFRIEEFPQRPVSVRVCSCCCSACCYLDACLGAQWNNVWHTICETCL